MKVVFQLFWRICLLRQSPAHVPTQGWFVAVVLVANLLVNVLVSLSIDQSVNVLTLATRIVVSQATYASLVWLATYLREVPSRFAGCLTALLGCDALITALFGVLAPLAAALDGWALNLLSLGTLIWSIAVTGYILAQALSVRVGIGVMLALGIMVMTVAAGNTAIGA